MTAAHDRSLTMPDATSKPSVEQLEREITAWLTDTSVGRKVANTNAITDLATGMAADFPDVDPATLGAVMLRLASFLACEADLPTWMLSNLTGAAGARLRGVPT